MFSNKLVMISLFSIFFIVVDLYVFQAVKTAFQNVQPSSKKIIFIIYWGLTLLTFIGFFIFQFADAEKIGRLTKNFILAAIVINYFVKTFVVLFLFIDDLIRMMRWIVQKINFNADKQNSSSGSGISRLKFLSDLGLIVASIPLMGIVYGIFVGAHDYKVKRIKLSLKNLPKSFEGLKIAQISDIHSGSFFNKEAVKRGINMLLAQRPDMVFFTGDLVNNEASEMKEYESVFAAIQAPMGVYSVLGNHDYGDYKTWASPKEKEANLDKLKGIHKNMGWNLMMNEHKIFERDGEKIAVIGIENFGAKGHFPKYGKLNQAHEGTEEAKVKLLLSHDPSHWDYEVNKKYTDIDAMFAGHTHGFQFGVEIAGIKWSPVKYMYDQWAGLYQKGAQYLYVNRGFGYIGFPGRVGMPPEITIFELTSGKV